MSLTQAQDGRVIHMPATPDAFRFDAEVARIFPNMAERSIPMYHEAHRMHVAMLENWLTIDKPIRILDVGASRGAFYKHFTDVYGDADIEYTAIDNSQPMLDLLKDEFPAAHTRCMEVGGLDFLAMSQRYDVVVANYIVQFIKPRMQYDVMQKLADLVGDAGVLIFGHKASSPGMLGAIAHDEYIRFRLRNGYTEEEIAAKTKALRNSMWPQDHEDVVRFLRAESFMTTETTRWAMFATIFATRG